MASLPSSLVSWYAYRSSARWIGKQCWGIYCRIARMSVYIGICEWLVRVDGVMKKRFIKLPTNVRIIILLHTAVATTGPTLQYCERSTLVRFIKFPKIKISTPHHAKWPPSRCPNMNYDIYSRHTYTRYTMRIYIPIYIWYAYIHIYIYIIIYAQYLHARAHRRGYTERTGLTARRWL